MINRYSSVPMYSQLKKIILEKIESGEYLENTKIPSEQELCELYNISRPTVRQAISELTSNGYLYKEKGKGTFVAKRKTIIDIKNYTGFTDSILDSQVPGEKSIIEINMVTAGENPKLSELFTYSPSSGKEFAKVIYLTLNDNEVVSCNVSYIPTYLFPNIIDDIKAKKPSYDIMRGKYPLVPYKSKSSLEIIYTDQTDSQYLQVQTGQALIKVENVIFAKTGQAIEYIISKYRADKCRFCFDNLK